MHTEDKLNNCKIPKIIPPLANKMLQQAEKENLFIFLILIINLPVSRRNRSRENRDAAKNR